MRLGFETAKGKAAPSSPESALNRLARKSLLSGNPRDKRFLEVAQAAEPAVSQVANLRMPEWLKGVGIERIARVRRLRVAPTGSPRNSRQGCLRYK